VSRNSGTRRIREDTQGHEQGANQVQEDTGGPAGILKDTSRRRFGTVRPRVQIPGPRTKFRLRFASSRCLAFLAFGPMGIAECWANYSLDAALIAAGGQGLLRVGKAIFTSDQIVKIYSS